MANRLLFISLLLGIYNSTAAQQFAINVVPRYSFGATIPANYRLVEGRSFLTPKLKTQYTGTLIGPNGDQSEYNQNSNGFGLDVFFKFTNEQNGNAWGLLLGVYRQKHLQHAEFPSFAFKGTNLVSYYYFYRTTGLSAGLRRVFMQNRLVGWYVQTTALYSLQVQKFLGLSNTWDEVTESTARYLERGTGIVSSISQVQPYTLAIAPEVGIVNRGNFGFELSLSYQYPVGAPLYLNRETYYQNNRVLGLEEATRTQQSLWLNLRFPINVFKRSRAARTPRPPKTYEPKPQPEPKPRRESKPPAPKFQDLCLTVVNKNSQQAVANAKLVYEGRTYTSNTDGKVLLVALKVGKKGAFGIEAANYEGGNIDFEMVAQEGCQSLKIELIPVPVAIPTAVEINGQSVKKGESIVLNAIEFEQGKSDLLPEGKSELDKVAAWMRQYPTLVIELSGHTSNEGDYAENVRLSKDRVAICKRYMAGQVVGSDARIKTVGYGPTKPRVPNTTPENRKKNRRVELKVESL